MDMFDEAKAIHRSLPPGENKAYWQGVKDGFRKALMFIDPESREDYQKIIETSGRENQNE